MRFTYTIIFLLGFCSLFAQQQSNDAKAIIGAVEVAKKQPSTTLISSAASQNKRVSSNPYWYLSNQPIVRAAASDGMPTVIQGTLPTSATASNRSSDEKVFSYLEAIKAPIQIKEPVHEFEIMEQRTDDVGKTHIRLAQKFEGIKVYGGEVLLHTDKEGRIDLFNGRNFPSPIVSSLTPSIEQAAAIAIAKEHVAQFTTVADEDWSANPFFKHRADKGELVIYHVDEDLEKERLAWALNIHPNKASHWDYFVDAHTGEVLNQYSTLCQLHHDIGRENWPTTNDFTSTTKPKLHAFGGPESAEARDLNGATKIVNTYELGGTYYMLDASKQMFDSRRSSLPDDPVGAIWTLDVRNTSPENRSFEPYHIKDNTNSWNSSLGALGVSAHTNASVTYDYYLSTHNRNSVNGRGGNIISFINVSEANGNSMENAFWDGQYIYYGNGGSAFRELARSLDVAGHEISHGIIQSTANLQYQGESGAMNEAFADIFAVMITRDNWEIGEEVVNPNTFRSGALRSLANPHNGGNRLGDPGWQPQHVSEQFFGREDNGGVHINSGIINHAFYLHTISELLGTDINANATKTEQIYFKALTDYLTTRSQFKDLRAAVILSARDLYGAQSAEVASADEAFKGVGINTPSVASLLDVTAPTQEEEPVEIEENVGRDFVVYTDDESSHLYIANSAGNVLSDPASLKPVKSRPSVTDDGTTIVYVAQDHTINEININWATGVVEEDVLDDRPYWRNVAISRDGRRIAAITEETEETSKDNAIYVFDLVLGGSQIFELYNPTFTQGISTGTVEFADALEFDLTGESILYDAFNSITSSFGSSNLTYWDIGFIKVWDNSTNFWEQDVENNIRKLYSGLPEDDSIGNPTFSKNSPDVIAFDYIANFNNEDDPDDPTDDDDRYYLLGANLLTSKLDTIYRNGQLSFPNYSRTDKQIIFNETTTDGNNVVAVIDLEDNKISSKGNPAILVLQTPGARLGVWFSDGSRSLTSTNELEKALTDFVIAPNPFDTDLTIQFTTETKKELQVSVADLLGRQLYSSTERVIAGENTIALPLPQLPVGTYLLSIQSEEGIIARKIGKVK